MQHLKSLLLFPIIVLVAIIFSSCQENPTTMTQENPSSPSLNKFTLPAGATIDNATLWVYSLNPKGNTVYAHNITSDWEECVVTWNSFNEAFDPTVIGSFPNVNPAGWKSVDITSLVAGWVDGSITNYGVLLGENVNDPGYILERSQYDSREGTHPPYLQIAYTFNGVQTVVDDVPIADVYVWQLNPDINYCFDDLLYTGTRSVNQKKYSLLKFEFETPPSGGCTLTPGYWKTHSIYGPAPYNDTWAQVGEDTPFFLSGKTYYQVLNTSPGGNAYYILSFQYIAAQLNFLNGADPTDAQAAFDQATALFNTYTPAQIGALSGNNPLRQQFISLATILGNYNTGIIGPGHCDD